MSRFWEELSLAEMNSEQWELLCDGCGKCCLHKLEDEDDGQVYYTDIACRYLNLKTARCNDYSHRQEKVPNCVTVSADSIGAMLWLPDTCAYKLLYLGEPLPAWHPLLAGGPSKMKKKGISVAGRAISETLVDEADFEERVIHWV